MKRDDLSPESKTLVLVQDDVHDPDCGSVVNSDDAEARISPLDRGFLYGDAVFETLRCYDGKPAFLDKHVERLNTALDELAVPAHFSESEVKRRVGRLMERMGSRDAYVRISVTRGERQGLLSPNESDPTLVAIAKRLEKREYPSAKVETTETHRPDGRLGRLKTHNYLSNVMAKAEVEDDTDEALMLNSSGYVASGSVSNVFFFDGDLLMTPSKNIRKGVTREVVMEIADTNYTLRIKNNLSITGSDINSGFLTNSTWGVRPIAEVDSIELNANDERVEEITEMYLDRAV